jgi:hypothetical protein
VNSLRRAVLILVVPAVAWVYLHSVLDLAYTHSTFVPDANSTAWHAVFAQPGFWESEGIVVALALAAWLLTGRMHVADDD